MPTKAINYQVVKGEKQWTYQLKITFNGKKIIEVTITDHYQLEHKAVIDNELIIKLLKKLNNKRLRVNKHSTHNYYKWETIYRNQTYRLIFWFKNNTTNHLWIRNCYPID